MPVTYTEPSALTATSGRPSPRIVVPFQILCQVSDPSGANFTTKIFGLGLPNGSVVKLSVIPTTYELPSAALATPSATSLPTPPHVVSVSNVWLWTLPIKRATAEMINIVVRCVFMVVVVSCLLVEVFAGLKTAVRLNPHRVCFRFSRQRRVQKQTS